MVRRTRPNKGGRIAVSCPENPGRYMMSRFPWSPVTVERLLILRAEGLKLSSIAAELGTTTYAIEHKLRRLRGQKPAQASQVMSRFPWSPVTVERLLILRAEGLKLSSIA